jgi:hypothetical protein
MPRKYEPETEIMRPGMLPPRLLWKGAAVMDKARSEQPKQYGAMLAIASHLSKRGLVTNAEHQELMTELQKKYRPTYSSAAKTSPTLNKHAEKALGKED